MGPRNGVPATLASRGAPRGDERKSWRSRSFPPPLSPGERMKLFDYIATTPIDYVSRLC